MNDQKLADFVKVDFIDILRQTILAEKTHKIEGIGWPPIGFILDYQDNVN